jgi:hypothetical protein
MNLKPGSSEGPANQNLLGGAFDPRPVSQLVPKRTPNAYVHLDQLRPVSLRAS